MNFVGKTAVSLTLKRVTYSSNCALEHYGVNIYTHLKVKKAYNAVARLTWCRMGTNGGELLKTVMTLLFAYIAEFPEYPKKI